ncbi:MAG: hypothetical protein GEV13_03255 [Rhodospirillales bacterium]|nr:hypothetical protein [Rhodospirillales bacterium]
MAAASRSTDDARRVRRALAVVAAAGLMLAAVIFAVMREEVPASGPTVGERIALLRAERAGLQARADGEARIGLLPAFRTAGLLMDALTVRTESDGDRAFDLLPAFRHQAFSELDALNGALKDALDKPGEGARLAAHKAAIGAAAQLDRLAADDAPLILFYTPRFVPPRQATGELTLAPGAPGAAPQGALRLDAPGGPTANPAVQAVPRYAPDFAKAGNEDAPLEIEIVGPHLATAGGPPPVLSIGTWRGRATVGPERLRFVVPRTAFATDGRRTSFAAATLSFRRASRAVSFQLLFTVLPDRPGSFAFDQLVRTTTLEANTLVSPEILSRAPAGETRTVRRCFDPPAGWRFDKERRRVVIVERLGWRDDVSDPALNAGSVEFVPAEEPAQVCIAVIARPVMRSARTATIGRFEATLVRDRPNETVAKSGVRALDWREAVRVPIEPGMVEWKLYVRLFDDIDREFEGHADADLPRASMPFLRIDLDDGGRVLVLRADPTAEP